MKISRNRIDLENARLEQAVFKNHHEIGVPVTATSTTTLDISSGNVFLLAHGTNITTLNVTNPSASGTLTSITIIRTKDATGTARTIAWPDSFLFPGDTDPTLTQTTGAVDVITAFTMNGGDTWVAFPAGLNMS